MPRELGGLVLPGAVEADQAGQQVEAAGLGLDNDPAARLLVTRRCDAAGAGEAVSDLLPLRRLQFAVPGMEFDRQVEDRLAVPPGVGGERELQGGVVEVLGPADGSPPLLFPLGVVVQTVPVSHDRVAGQALRLDNRTAQRLFESVGSQEAPPPHAGDHRPLRASSVCTRWLSTVTEYQPQSTGSPAEISFGRR